MTLTRYIVLVPSAFYSDDKKREIEGDIDSAVFHDSMQWRVYLLSMHNVRDGIIINNCPCARIIKRTRGDLAISNQQAKRCEHHMTTIKLPAFIK